MRRKLIRMTAHDCTLGLLKGQLRFLNQSMDVTLVAKDTGTLKQLADAEGVAYRLLLWQVLFTSGNSIAVLAYLPEYI
ncbi:MAG: hypothetical protein J1F20_02255 [Muribaculaceae bacterium]|nr:hypothetical protein [Muribaculaceae bacterium]